MRKSFKLRCDYANQRHTMFTVFDPSGANCGTVTILTADVAAFLQYDWQGTVDWNGKEPK